MSFKKVFLSALLVSSVAFGAVSVSTSPASATGTVPADVQTSIDNATATVGALSPLALACLVVALTPFGAMLTLRFLNMVLSRV